MHVRLATALFFFSIALPSGLFGQAPASTELSPVSWGPFSQDSLRGAPLLPASVRLRPDDLLADNQDRIEGVASAPGEGSSLLAHLGIGAAGGAAAGLLTGFVITEILNDLTSCRVDCGFDKSIFVLSGAAAGTVVGGVVYLIRRAR